MDSIWYGPGALWGGEGTYAAYPLADMPALDDDLRGAFEWLTPSDYGGLAYMDRPEYAPAPDDPSATPEDRLLRALMGPPPERLPSRPGWWPLSDLTAEAAENGLALPASMITFLSRPDLHGRVPTCTSCYLDLSRRLLDGPEGGRLVRFMNDQQCVLVWYVLLEKSGHSVVANPEWNDAETDVVDDAMEPRNFVRCAASFEEFAYRFWIENTIWFRKNKNQPLRPREQAYADAARASVKP
jgi:hypothetical protein